MIIYGYGELFILPSVRYAILYLTLIETGVELSFMVQELWLYVWLTYVFSKKIGVVNNVNEMQFVELSCMVPELWLYIWLTYAFIKKMGVVHDVNMFTSLVEIVKI